MSIDASGPPTESEAAPELDGVDAVTSIDDPEADTVGTRLNRRASDLGNAVTDWVRSLGVTPAEEISPHEPPVAAAIAATPARRIDGITLLSALSGLVGTLLIAASAPVWGHAAPSWRLVVPGVPHPGSSFVAAAFFTAGLVLLGFGWVGIIGRAERLAGSNRRKWITVIAVGILWTFPVLLGPPLLSNDVYSYAAQGEMASRGVDPTSCGPVCLGRGDFLTQVDGTWRTAPAPYGPVWIGLSKGVVEVTGHDPAAAVWAFRVMALIGVLLAAVGVVQIARCCGVSDTVAIAVGIVNPLVIIYLIGGSHNDALMMGFLCLGVAAALRDKRWLAVVLIALATAIKLPAAAALLFVGWHFAGVGAPLRKKLVETVKVVAPAMALIAAFCLVFGVGIGWITALQNTGKVMDTFSLMTMLGYFASDGTNALVAAGKNPEVLVTPVRMLGVLISGLVSLVLLVKLHKVGLPRAIGFSMLVVVVLGPVMWPWYLPAGFALIAAAGLGRYRPSYLVVVVASTALVWPTSVDPIYQLVEYQRVLSFSVIVLIAVFAFIAQKYAGRREARRALRHRQAAALHEEQRQLVSA